MAADVPQKLPAINVGLVYLGPQSQSQLNFAHLVNFPGRLM